jgi:hypothetical protein
VFEVDCVGLGMRCGGGGGGGSGAVDLFIGILEHYQR